MYEFNICQGSKLVAIMTTNDLSVLNEKNDKYALARNLVMLYEDNSTYCDVYMVCGAGEEFSGRTFDFRVMKMDILRARK